ncbi:hypothetical protein AC249_AIPGENE15583 [Exaiptasia diaphana]|nr:hypothetical protein AC249_AIPGENE15583 [Exaiptasia diaphana]
MNLEIKLQKIHAEFQLAIRKIKPKREWSNLNSAERKTLKSLRRRKDLVCLPSDKGSEFCVIDKPSYVNAAHAHLNDASIYKPIKRMTAKTIEGKINSTWKRICDENDMPKHIKRSFIASNTDLPEIYHLIKTRKPEEQGVKVEFILTSYNMNPIERYRCKVDKCPLATSGLCFKRGVVYEITCTTCESKYIGSTIRHLHDRVKEHLSSSKSSVASHLRSCSNTTQIKTRVTARDRDPVNLRLLEALFIKSLKPTINSREECRELQDLLF